MLDKLVELEKRYAAVSALIADADVIADQERWRDLMREHAGLQEVMDAAGALRACMQTRDEAHALMQGEDIELRALAQEEYEQAQSALPDLEENLKRLLLPKDPNDEKNVVLEIRAGTGGEEAALFGMDLLRMYTRYAERHLWQIQIVDISETELGGVKEATLLVSGRGAYSRLKFESGAHRVQRVPSTESGGRIHTSAATVAVLPEVQDVQIVIDPNDLKIDTYRSGGAGGQHVNKTESAIRITHLPTGIVVSCQNERSQIKNREQAMRVLKSRLYDFYEQQRASAYSENRRAQVGTGDRSERIRTYNFPQNRVSDHRINLTLYQLESFLDGDMDEMIEALIMAEQAARLEALQQEEK
nr:peptide chain release factor 1 [Maliibacterium massiliense]